MIINSGKIQTLFLLIACFLIIHISPCYSQSKAEAFTQNNHYFDSLNLIYKQHQFDSLFTFIVKEKYFNGAFLIARGNDILYENVAGYSNYSNQKPLDIHASFEIASVSKMFTAVAILMLYEEGKIDLTKKVRDYLPDFPYNNITVHQLLCHRSGLPEYFKFAERYHKNPSFPLTNDSLLLMIQKHQPKYNALPDKEFEYCNTNYAILAAIVEKVSEIPFSQYLETKLFKPLEMNETFLYQYGNNQTILIGHRSNKKEYERNYLSGVVGDKGIFTSVHDLYDWDKALFNGKLIKKETLAIAVFPHNPDQMLCNNYGYGLRIRCDEQKNILLYHGGLWNGNNSLFIHRPIDNTLIIFLSNIYNKSFTWRSADMLRILDEL